MERWSFSKIEATKGCKIAYEKRYIQGLPPDTEVPMFTEAKETHEKIQGKFLKREIDHPLIVPYLEGSVYTEKEYKYFFEDMEFVAYADVVLETETDRLILDIKSRYNADITDRDGLQLLTYLALANAENPMAQNKVGVYAAYNNFSPVTIADIEPPPLSFIVDEIEKAKKRIPRMTVKTSECASCEYRKNCEYGLKMENDNSLAAIAEKYLYLKAQVDMYEEMLKKHAETTGEKIRVGDKEIGFFERVYTIIDTTSFITLCENNNIPYIDAVKIDVTKAKQRAKKYDVLTQAFDKEVKYVFTTKKIGGGEK